MTKSASLASALGLVRRSETPPAQPEPGAGVRPPARSDLGPVTPLAALSLDAVYRSVLILQTACQQLTLDAWRNAERHPDPPSIVSKPDPETDLTEWVAETVTSLALRGNAYWRLIRGADDAVIAAQVLDPTLVSPHYDRRRRVRFTYDGRDYTRRDIAHLRLMILPGAPAGLGPIQAAATTVGGTIQRARYADNWFTESGVPNGILRTDQDLTPERAAEAKRAWREGNKNHGDGPAVLGKGLDYRALMLKPAEAQWLEGQNFGVAGIARLFGIPPAMLVAAVEGTSRTYTNAQQEDIALVRYTLMSYLRPIEAAMTRILPRTTTVRVNVDGLLRTDTKTRYESHEIGIRAGFLSRAEVREIEGIDGPAPTPQTTPETDEVSLP